MKKIKNLIYMNDKNRILIILFKEIPQLILTVFDKKSRSDKNFLKEINLRENI